MVWANLGVSWSGTSRPGTGKFMIRAGSVNAWAAGIMNLLLNAADIEPVTAKDYVPPWARGDFDFYQDEVGRSIASCHAQQGAVWR